MSSKYFNGINQVFTLLSGGNDTSNKVCVSQIVHFEFYKYILIPASILTIIFAMFEKRKSLSPNLFGGRPGCIYPMDALSRSTRLSYACAFGATIMIVYGICFHDMPAFEYTGPLYLKSLVPVASVIVYGMAFYPIFASITQGTVFSYGLGSLYVWTFTGIQFYKSFECDSHLTVRLLSLARDFPNLGCWVYLSLTLPYWFLRKLSERTYFHARPSQLEKRQTLDDIMDSYQGHAVRKLLIRHTHKPEMSHGWFYHWQKDFHYSSRILSVMLVGFQLIYILTYEVITGYYYANLLMTRFIKESLKTINGAPPPDEPPLATESRQYLSLILKIAYPILICVMVSAGIAFVLGVLHILHMLSSYRRNLQALYRGDSSHIPPIDAQSNTYHMVGFLRYAGYQVGYIGWGYIIQFIVLSLVSITLSTVIGIIIYGYYDWLVNIALQLWPVLVIALALNILQLVLAKFFFLQGDNLAMDNRRALFVYTYFMFFFNVFLGFVSCTMRILKSIVIGTLILGRLDHSTLSRRFQFFDPGFASYVGFLHVENAHTHPVVVVFVRLMLMNLQTKQHTLETRGGYIRLTAPFQRRRYSRARFNWFVMYTLHNNPSLRMYRKSEIQGKRDGKRHM